MLKDRLQSSHIDHFRRKKIIKNVSLAVTAVLLILLALFLFLRIKNSGKSEKEALLVLWESSDFEKSYIESRERLKQNPLDFFLLTVRGFSAYQLARAQINAFDTLNYIDDCIYSLRKTLLLPEGVSDGRIYYVLGKAYYEKGSGYAELAVNYLEKSLSLNFEARDIPQYLGLSYAEIKDYRSSVAAFSLALNNPDSIQSDSLLIAIANSYRSLGEMDAALAYLFRCVETSHDIKSIAASRLLIGEILAEKNDFSGAEVQYKKILEDGGENADAHFYLGELYAAGGDPTRARAEWRAAVRVDPAHRKARARLNG
jgi:tetratricopeptide (TPR) repeat protein